MLQGETQQLSAERQSWIGNCNLKWGFSSLWFKEFALWFL